MNNLFETLPESSIVRKVIVPSEDFLTLATKGGRKKGYVNEEVVAEMPSPFSAGTEVELFYMPLRKGELTSAKQFHEILEEYGLKSDPRTHAADVAADPKFADLHPSGSQWLDNDIKFCYAVFRLWPGARLVGVDQGARGWNGSWWLVGVRPVLGT